MFIGCSYTVPARQNLPGQSEGDGGGSDTTSFIMEIDTNISGSTPSNQFRLYSSGNTGIPYTVDWGDGNSDVDTTSNDITHTYDSPGIYDISITSPYNRILNGAINDKRKITKIKQWGNLPWRNMGASFSRCSNLNITATDTGDFSNVTSWSECFRDNTTLSNLGDYSNWVTSSCNNLFAMLLNCDNLSGAFDFTGWDVSNVTNISYLIANSRNFTSIDTTGWDVSKVTTFFNFASNCQNLDTIIGHENWDISSATNLANFFTSTKLTQFDPSNWDVSNVNTFSQAFRGMFQNNVGSIDLSNWNIKTSGPVNMYIIFGFSNKLTSVGDISSWDVSRVTNLGYFGANCSVLQLPNLSSWNTGNVTNLRNAFQNMGTSASVSGIENWDTSSVNNVVACFQGCRALNTTAINWDLRNCNNLYQTFRQADFQNGSFTLNIQTDSTLTNVSQLFYASSSFNSITIGNNVDFSNVTNFSYAFGQMGSLSLTLPTNFSFASGTSFTQFLTGTTLSSSDYNTLLIYIEASNQNNNITFDAPTCVATGAGLTARNALINDHGWTINDNS